MIQACNDQSIAQWLANQEPWCNHRHNFMPSITLFGLPTLFPSIDSLKALSINWYQYHHHMHDAVHGSRAHTQYIIKKVMYPMLITHVSILVHTQPIIMTLIVMSTNLLACTKLLLFNQFGYQFVIIAFKTWSTSFMEDLTIVRDYHLVCTTLDIHITNLGFHSIQWIHNVCMYLSRVPYHNIYINHPSPLPITSNHQNE